MIYWVILFIFLVLVGYNLTQVWNKYSTNVGLIPLHMWQELLSNCHSPKAIIDAKNERILLANSSFVRVFGLVKKNQDDYVFSFPHQRLILKKILRSHAWPIPFWEMTIGLRPHSSLHSSMAKISAVPLGSYHHLWLFSLELENDDFFSDESDHLSRTAINSLSELVSFQDIEGQVVGSNQAFDHFWHGREEESQLFDDMAFTGRRTAQHWTTTPTGASCLLETNQTLLIDSHNNVLGSLTISHDVTNWHTMQQNMAQEIAVRQQIELQLKKHSNLLNAIFEASVDPIGIYSNEYQFLGGNPAFAEAMGVSLNQIEGMDAAKIVDPVILAQHKKIDLPVLQAGKTIKYEDLVVKRDGSVVWYEMRKTQFYDPADDITGVLVIARDVTERKATQQELADAIMELEELSFIDGLTKVANRRSFDEQLTKLWQAHIRDQQSLSLILCDIDFFKAYNDNYGHQQGDEALRQVAAVFTQVIQRPLDLVARYGGEEFAILLPDTNLDGAVVVAQNIAAQLDLANIQHEFSNVSAKLTLSQGVACLLPQCGQDYGELVALADEALYRAKHLGRDQIAVDYSSG